MNDAAVAETEANERAARKIGEESEDILRAMTQTPGDTPLDPEILTMHLRVKSLTDRLQLGPLHTQPHVLALIVVLAGADVAPFEETPDAQD